MMEDGSVFRSREGRLPPDSDGRYREYTVETPTLSHRGQRHVVAEESGRFYDTDDHYESFMEVVDP
jgi:ribonuclease T1